jgi:hypothetical protein
MEDFSRGPFHKKVSLGLVFRDSSASFKNVPENTF